MALTGAQVRGKIKILQIKQGRCTHFDADIYDGTFS